MENFKTSMKNL